MSRGFTTGGALLKEKQEMQSNRVQALMVPGSRKCQDGSKAVNLSSKEKKAMQTPKVLKGSGIFVAVYTQGQRLLEFVITNGMKLNKDSCPL